MCITCGTKASVFMYKRRYSNEFSHHFSCVFAVVVAGLCISNTLLAKPHLGLSVTLSKEYNRYFGRVYLCK